MYDLLYHVPEARRRAELIERLIAARKKPGGGGYVTVWGCGLSAEEIEWWMTMGEKYDENSAQWPKEEVEARDAAHEIKRRNMTKQTFDPAGLFGPTLR